MSGPRSTASPSRNLPLNQILVGDARTMLDDLPADSVDCVITSPPYFRLRNYGQERQIGLESSVDQWVDELLLVMRGLKRVLKPTGSLWLNLGDTFARTGSDCATPKSLVLAPERLALAMIEDGWILRNKVIWAKRNPMPTSVSDRLSCTWEVIYFFTRERHYFFNLDAIREPHQSRSRKQKERIDSLVAVAPDARQQTHHRRQWSVPTEWQGPASGNHAGLDALRASGRAGHPLGKNPGDVWQMSTAGYRGAHHAVYPASLVERPLLATCPEKTCAACGAPWRRAKTKPTRSNSSSPQLHIVGDLTQVCTCETPTTVPGIALDPFMGSGTTAVVAARHGRDWIGVELNPSFAAQARERIEGERRKRKAMEDNGLRPPSIVPSHDDTGTDSLERVAA